MFASVDNETRATMGKKWQKIDPAELKVGDQVKAKNCEDGSVIMGRANRRELTGLAVGQYWFTVSAEPHITWYVRKPKRVKADNDLSEDHTAKHWHARYLKQLQHTERLQEANRGRRQKMQLLKKEAKDARAQVQGWESRYAVLAASFTESDYHSAETQAQLDDAMLTIEDQRTELKNLRQALADEQNSTPLTRPDEPPVGTLFRIGSNPTVWLRHTGNADGMTVCPYVSIDADPFWAEWEFITKPGDTITLLELREVGK